MSTWQDKAKRISAEQPLAPLLPLYPYQLDVINDLSRLKGWVKSRQVGGTFTGTLDMVLDSLHRLSDWNTMSRTGRQAKKLLRKAAMHVEAIDAFVRHTLNQPTIIEKISSEEIVFRSGGILAALPCDPDTTVGDTVNWFLDEWALYPDSETIFGTIKPSIMHGKRLFGVSTPRGRKGKFADLYQSWQNHGPASGWSFHSTTIEQAMARGLKLTDHLGRPITFEQFREQEMKDLGLEMFLQEYMCVFQDLLSAFLRWEQIRACLAPGDPLSRPPDALAAAAAAGAEIYMGVDIGRRHDLTVLWIIARYKDGTSKTLAAIELEKADFDVQMEMIREYMIRGRLARCCIDYTGLGMQLCETLQKQFVNIVPVTFTNTKKQVMAERLKVAIDGGTFTIPAGENPESDAVQDIVEDFASIEKIITDAGNIRLEASRGQRTHGDYFWAATLALEAASSYGPAEAPISVSKKPRKKVKAAA